MSGLVRRARNVNDGMAAYAVDEVTRRLGDLNGRSVLILGLAYRGGQKEASFSSALLLIRALRERGARALLNDPLFSDDEILAVGAEPGRSKIQLRLTPSFSRLTTRRTWAWTGRDFAAANSWWTAATSSVRIRSLALGWITWASVEVRRLVGDGEPGPG